MEVWSFVNSKGGVGKTTLAINIAHCLTLKKKNVILIDTDDQGSAMDWAGILDADKPFPVVSCVKKNMLRNLIQTLNTFDYVLIDTPGKFHDVIGGVIGVSHKVVIPVMPSPYDIWAMELALQLINERRDMRQDGPLAAFVINRAVQSTRIGREFMTTLEQFEFPILKGRATQRIGYCYSAAAGQTVFDAGPKEAMEEIEEITKEIMALKNEVEA